MNNPIYKTCSFFGHRKIWDEEKLVARATEEIESLIVFHNVDTFLFGTRSEFNTLCHQIVTGLKEKYSNIKRIAYTCKSECCTLESDLAQLEETCSDFFKKKVSLLGFEEVRDHKNKWDSGRASYAERNRAMIDDSYFCIFFYDKNYQPEMRKFCKQSLSYYQPKSGTALAHKYAMQKKKYILNLINLIP